MNRLQEFRIECVKIAASRSDIKPDEIDPQKKKFLKGWLNRVNHFAYDKFV